MKEIVVKDGAKQNALVQLERNALPSEQFSFYWVKGLCVATATAERAALRRVLCDSNA